MLTGPVRRVIQKRLEEASTHLESLRARQGAAEKRLAALRDVEIETAWVTETLTHFDAIWGALTSSNRGRFVRALIESVVVDGAKDTIRIELAAGAARLEDCA